MDKRPIMNKWYTRLISVALVLVVLCQMGWPGKIMVADAEESGTTVVTSGDVTPGDAGYAEKSVAEQYLEEIAALKAEALLIDGTSADVTLMCADVYERLMGVYNEAFTAYENDLLTNEDIEEVNTATQEVMSILGELGYDPYAIELLEYNLNMDNFKPTSAVYWQVMTGNSTNGYSKANDQSTVISVKLNSLDVVHCDSTKKWTGGNTLSNYYPNVSQGGSSVSKTLVVTPADGYYVTRVIVACTSNGQSSPYNCNTWKADNAYEKEFSVGTSGAVSIDLPSEAFGHSSESPAYFILVAVEPIPSPLYVEYDYGEIVGYMNSAGINAEVFSGSPYTWTTAAETTTISGTANANYYGTGSIQTLNTQFEYAYEGAANASEAAQWSHYANTVTRDAKLAAAEAGYYFAGWRAEYYTSIKVTETRDSGYNNYKYEFDGNTLYGVGTYNETEKVILTTNVRLIAQWKPVELTITKSVTGLNGTAFSSQENSYTLQLQRQDNEDKWLDYEDAVILKITGDGSESATISPIIPGTYRVSETAGNTNLSNDSTVMYITVNSDGSVTVTKDAIVEGNVNGYELTVTNSYSASAPAIKLVKRWVDANNNIISANNENLPAVTFNITDGNKTITKNLASKIDYDEKENAWIAYVNVAELSGTLEVTESPIDGYELDSIISNIIAGTEMNIDGTSCYCTVAYTATNKQSTTNLTITKKVSGSMGDLSKEFNFEAKVMVGGNVYYLTSGEGYSVNTENGIISFNLSHGGSVTLSSVPLGAELWIKETNADGYTITVGGSKLEDGWYKIPVTNNLAVTVSNYKEATPDTGILLDSLPYVLILVIVIAGVVIMILRRRRSYDED